MVAVKKKGIKKAIIIYEDPDTGLSRRIIFGDPDGLMEMFIENSQLVFNRIQDIQNSSSQNPQQLMEAVENTKLDWIVSSNSDAGEDMEMSLEYKIFKRR